jgi:hypothetical protein
LTDPDRTGSVRAPRIALRASAGLAGALILGAASAAWACRVVAAPVIGPSGATLLALLAAAWLALRSRAAWRRRVPAQLGIDAGAGTLAAYDRAGRLLAEGRVVGGVQWSDLLLALTVCGRARRVATLLVPADAVDVSTFRVLSVLGRRARRGSPARA